MSRTFCSVSKLDKNGKWTRLLTKCCNDACTPIVLSLLFNHGRDNDRAGEYILCICRRNEVYGSKLTELAATTVGARANKPSSKSPELLTKTLHDIVVHPLVLLSVADHHARSVARGSSKRVVGVLLGQDKRESINVANSFGVPFEEDDKDAKTWFLDHNYVEGMFEMFKKVNGAYLVPTVRTV